MFELLGTLTGHHTRYCLRKAQPAYRRQVYERYEPLVGYERKRHRRGAMGVLGKIVPKVAKRSLFGSNAAADDAQADADQIFSSEKDTRNKGLKRNYEGHKYFFAINLVRFHKSGK